MEHILYEHPNGYTLFELGQYEDLATSLYTNATGLAQMLKFVSNYAFDNVQTALEHCNWLSKGKIHPDLEKLLRLAEVRVLHCDASLHKSLVELSFVPKESANITRGIRLNQIKLCKTQKNVEAQMALGLAHAFSRNHVENIKVEDNVVMNTVMLLEQLDKDISSYTMRVKEIYGWIFPELSSIVKNSSDYIVAVRYFMGNNARLQVGEAATGVENDRTLDGMGKLDDSETELLFASYPNLETCYQNTIGMPLSVLDEHTLVKLCEIVQEKIRAKRSLMIYLKQKMSVVAPNLSVLLGEVLAAKLIYLAGGLFNLGKASASTLQLLGAEKALFKALKDKTPTPKYGVIYSSKQVKEVDSKTKARISRYLATKCAIAVRIDCFSESRNCEYGQELRNLVQEKINSIRHNYEVEKTGDVMKRVYDKLNENNKRSIGDTGGNDCENLKKQLLGQLSKKAKKSDRSKVEKEVVSGKHDSSRHKSKKVKRNGG